MEGAGAALGALGLFALVVAVIVLAVLGVLMPWFVYRIAKYQRLTFELLRDRGGLPDSTRREAERYLK